MAMRGLGQNPNDPFYYTYDDLVALQEAQQGSGGGGGLGGGKGNNNFNFAKMFSGKDSLGNNPNEYSSIGPRQGSTLPAGDQGNGATTTPINFNDGGIETTTFDGAGNQIGETTTSPGTGSSGDSSGGSSGSWVSAAIGAIRGWNQGQKNYESDPAMTSGEDGFGKYHKDYRANVGGASLGGVAGYYGGSAGAGLAAPLVEWFHPYAQDMTRDVIMFGDKVDGARGAFALDPIGATASGKYKFKDLFKV